MYGNSPDRRPPPGGELPRFEFPNQHEGSSIEHGSVTTKTAETLFLPGNTALVTSDSSKWQAEGVIASTAGRPRTSSYTSQPSGYPDYFNRNSGGFNPTVGSHRHPSSAGSGTHGSQRLGNHNLWGQRVFSAGTGDGNPLEDSPYHIPSSAPPSQADSTYSISDLLAESNQTWDRRLKDLHNAADIEHLEFEETMDPKPNNGVRVTRKYTASFSRQRRDGRRGRSDSTSSQNPDPAPLGQQPMRPDAASFIPVASHATQGSSVDGIGKEENSGFEKGGEDNESVDGVDDATLPQSAVTVHTASLSDSLAAAEQYPIPKGPEAERSDESMQSVNESRTSKEGPHGRISGSRGAEKGHAAGRGRGSGGLPRGQGRGRGNNSDTSDKKAEKPKSERGRGRGRGMGREVGFHGGVRVPKGHRGVKFGEGYLKKMHGVEGPAEGSQG